MMPGMTIKIFLGNLSSDTTSDKIRPLFEKYGEVVECDVLKNFGFVHMTNKNDANKAIAQLDGYSIDGNNIRVELSTGKKGGGGGGGKFDKKGLGYLRKFRRSISHTASKTACAEPVPSAIDMLRCVRQSPIDAGTQLSQVVFRYGEACVLSLQNRFSSPRGRPYGPPPPRDPRDYDRYPYPVPPIHYDRYDPYYRYIMEREAYYSRLAPLPGDRGYPASGARERYPPVPPPPRDRMGERYPPPPDPRDRIPPRSYMEDRGRPLPPDPYFRDRDPLAARPPPEYYERKMPMGSGRGGEPPIGAAGAAGGRASGGFGNGDFYRNMDRPGASMGGAAGGLGGAGNGPGDFLGRPSGGQNNYGRQSGPMGGGGGVGKPDSQSSFATDPIFF